MKKRFTTMIMGVAVVLGCTGRNGNNYADSAQVEPEATAVTNDGDHESPPTKDVLVEIVDTCGLRIYYPQYSRIDLVCGEMPKMEDESVIMFVEAAFTGELLETFQHSRSRTFA